MLAHSLCLFVCLCVCVCVSECAHMLRRINNVSEKLSRHNIIDSTQLRWVPYRPTNRQTDRVSCRGAFAPKNMQNVLKLKRYSYFQLQLNFFNIHVDIQTYTLQNTEEHESMNISHMQYTVSRKTKTYESFCVHFTYCLLIIRSVLCVYIYNPKLILTYPLSICLYM